MTARRGVWRLVGCGMAVWAMAVAAGLAPSTGRAAGHAPTATLVAAPLLRLSGEVDSNSPALWDMVRGRLRLHVLTSFAGQPSVSDGLSLTRIGQARAVSFLSHPGHGVWMEAVVADDAGVWYGYYHNEVPADLCARPARVLPRIGAARSSDSGATWEDLGIILEAPPGAHKCDTPNDYFVGGVGDLSVMLDPESQFLYLFFSQYSRSAWGQGVAVARMAWADRDDPAGAVDVWTLNNLWQPAVPVLVDDGEPGAGLGEQGEGEAGDGELELTWEYPSGRPLARPWRPWHDRDPVNDAFWGASVHWNTYLGQYVMLLNRARDERFGQEGIYVSFAPSLEDPRFWTPPQRVLEGGSWYPQVIGLEPGQGTDKQAGARARFFLSGASNHYIDFQRAN